MAVTRPPGPAWYRGPLALIRREDPTELLRRLAADHPHLAFLRFGPERVYLVNQPELVAELLVRHRHATRKGRIHEGIRRVLGDGLLTSEAEHHERQRRLVQPALTGDRVNRYRQLMVATAGAVTAGWRDGDRVDLAREHSGLTLTVVGRALFGRGLEPETAELAACMEVLLGGFARHLVPGGDRLLAVPTPGHRRIRAAAGRLDEIGRRLVTEAAGRPADADLLAHLVATMPPDQARDEALTLLLAGHETTATALTWCWWLLDRDPAVKRWWRAELDAVGVTDRVDRLPRTQAVLAEAMRLYPPSWLLARRVLRPIRLGGWTLPAGALAVASQAALHRDARYWPEPDRFRPRRWLAPGFDLAAPGVPRGAYLPFGLGARACVGGAFAWTEGTLLLAAVGRDWTPRLLPGHRVAPAPSVTLRPRGGLPVQLCRR